MAHEFLPQFRRRLFDWLQFRVENGRLPFRRVEERPEIITADGLQNPDLVLWINRDSLFAGAMILIPPKTGEARLAEAGCIAAALGLRQFVTWEARAVNLWETGAADPILLKSWPMPDADDISMDDFAAVFEHLILELKNRAVSATLPAEQLPPFYYVNLCRQMLRDGEPAMLEAARMAAKAGQTDTGTRQAARDKRWLTLWRILALLWRDRFPPGINPERLERALEYALTASNREGSHQLVPARDELPLPEIAAVRFHQLAGRLTQLGWQRDPAKAQRFLSLLLTAMAREFRVATTPLDLPAGRQTLLVNHLPPQPPADPALIAPSPCLAALALMAEVAGTPPALCTAPDVMSLAAAPRPRRIVATLHDDQPLSAALRRQRQTAMRTTWPYRRFELPANTPTWLWDALHLTGLVDATGELQLTLPAAWFEAPGAEQLWRALTERLTLVELRLCAGGDQTILFTDHDRAADSFSISYPDGTRKPQPLPDGDEGLVVIAACSAAQIQTQAVTRPGRRGGSSPAGDIAAKVFRDGLPCFPDHYLRRIDLPPLRCYQLPGPLQASSHFFDRIRLTAADGSIVDCDNPTDAEALLLASQTGCRQVSLPVDQELTLRLIAAYRHDLQRLWQNLLDECRRRLPTQRTAQTLARRLWQERSLPPIDGV